MNMTHPLLTDIPVSSYPQNTLDVVIARHTADRNEKKII